MTAVEPSLGKRIRITPALAEPRSSREVPARDDLLDAAKRLRAMTQLGGAGLNPGGERLRFPIAAARIQRPHLPEQTLHRLRLLSWLDEHIDRRLICVIAEAGYGKSTLLADFSRRTRVRTAWYRSAEDHRDAVTVVRYLVAAGRLVEPEFAPRTTLLLDGDTGAIPTDEAAIATLVSELDGLTAQPTALIVDDYHEIDDVPEIRDLFMRVLENAPEHLSLVIASRRDPGLPVARLRSLGEHADLSRRDLRFDHEETERFFRESAGLPLERTILDDVERRTEGWAASLSLVATSLRGRSDAEVRSFVRRLSGAHGALFDFLAEEVVGDLEEAFQSFLMRVSILQVIDPDLAAVAAGLDRAEVAPLVSRAMRLGLLTPAADGQTRRGATFHPLVREFLEARLSRSVSDAEIASMHMLIAESAHARDWQVSAHHFEAAGELERLCAVLRRSASLIMGAGDFAAAERFLARGDIQPDPLFDIIRSRSLLQHQRVQEARSFAARALAALGPEATGEVAELAAANLITIEYLLHNLDRADELAVALGARAESTELGAIARVMAKLIGCTRLEPIEPVREELRQLVRAQEAAGHSHYVGITYLNLSLLDRVSLDPTACAEHSARSMAALAPEGKSLELSVATLVHSWAVAFFGECEAAEALVSDVLSGYTGFGQSEVLGEAADVAGALIDPELADKILARSEDLDPIEAGMRGELQACLAEAALRRLDLSTAERALAAAKALKASSETAHVARLRSLEALLLLEKNDLAGCEMLAGEAIELARRQGANNWLEHSLLVRACIGDGDFSGHIREVARRNPTLISISAEIVAQRLHLLSEDAWLSVRAEIVRRPRRWHRCLRRALESSVPECRLRAAVALDEIGERSDIALLRRLAKQPAFKKKYAHLGRGLAARLALPAFVEDQGRVEVFVGSEKVPEAQARRKALALLCFLLARPDFVATKDQVLDALWPDADPDDSVNSLNQTLFYLRRFFEPDYNEDLSARYVINDSQLIWLNPELINSRSQCCLKLIRQAGGNARPDQVAEIRKMYRGRFALDFAYEDWAADFRERLHSAYLEVMEKAVLSDTQAGHFERALDTARAILEIDPRSVELEQILVTLYKRRGAHAAATEQYAHYSALVRSELGVEPLPWEDL